MSRKPEDLASDVLTIAFIPALLAAGVLWGLSHERMTVAFGPFFGGLILWLAVIGVGILIWGSHRYLEKGRLLDENAARDAEQRRDWYSAAALWKAARSNTVGPLKRAEYKRRMEGCAWNHLRVEENARAVGRIPRDRSDD